MYNLQVMRDLRFTHMRWGFLQSARRFLRLVELAINQPVTSTMPPAVISEAARVEDLNPGRLNTAARRLDLTGTLAIGYRGIAT